MRNLSSVVGKFTILLSLILISGCSSLKGVQAETCQTVAAVVVPLFCPIEEEKSDG